MLYILVYNVHNIFILKITTDIIYLWRVIELNGSIFKNERSTSHWAYVTLYKPGTYVLMVQGNSEINNALLFNASKVIIGE